MSKHRLLFAMYRDRASMVAVETVAAAQGMESLAKPLVFELVVGPEPVTEPWTQTKEGEWPPWWTAEDEATAGGIRA